MSAAVVALVVVLSPGIVHAARHLTRPHDHLDRELRRMTAADTGCPPNCTACNTHARKADRA